MVEPRNVRVEPATLELLAAWIRGRDEFAEMIGCAIPDGWPEFEQGMSFVHGILERRPDEVGYEIAPAYRRQGWATAATLVMTQRAFESGLVDVVIAHTMPEENDSTKVLRASGFEFAGEVPDPDEGVIWRWVRSRQPV